MTMHIDEKVLAEAKLSQEALAGQADLDRTYIVGVERYVSLCR